MVDDESVMRHIEQLVDEEGQLRGAGEGLSAEDQERLRDVEARLDQCWDLLRQRRAQRRFGRDEDEATVRPVEQVENYVR